VLAFLTGCLYSGLFGVLPARRPTVSAGPDAARVIRTLELVLTRQDPESVAASRGLDANIATTAGSDALANMPSGRTQRHATRVPPAWRAAECLIVCGLKLS